MPHSDMTDHISSPLMPYAAWRQARMHVVHNNVHICIRLSCCCDGCLCNKASSSQR